MRDLLQVMFEDGYFSAAEAIALKKTCRELNENPVRLLRSLNLAPTIKIQSYFSSHFGLQALTNAEIQGLNAENKELLPQDLAKNLGIIPLSHSGGVLRVGMEDPLEKAVIRQLEFFLDTKVICVAATAQQIVQGLKAIYGLSSSELKLSTLIEEAMGVAASRLQTHGFEDAHKPLKYSQRQDVPFGQPETFHHSDEMLQLDSFDTNFSDGESDARTSTLFEGRFQGAPEKDDDTFETKGIFSEESPAATEEEEAKQNAFLRDLGLGDMGSTEAESAVNLDLMAELGLSDMGSTEAEPAANLDLMAELGLIDFPGDNNKTDEQASLEMSLTDEIGALLASAELEGEKGSEPVANEPLLPEDETPSAELNSDAEELAELDLENELNLSEQLILPPVVEEPLATLEESVSIPQEFLNELSGLVNSALVKFAFTKDKTKALEILNEKILELGAKVELREDGTFVFSCPQYAFESVIDENAKIDSDLGDRVAPALKKLRKMA